MMARPIKEGTRYYLIGIVTELLPFFDSLESQFLKYRNLVAENSGLSVAVSIDVALELIKQFWSKFEPIKDYETIKNFYFYRYWNK